VIKKLIFGFGYLFFLLISFFTGEYYNQSVNIKGVDVTVDLSVEDKKLLPSWLKRAVSYGYPQEEIRALFPHNGEPKEMLVFIGRDTLWIGENHISFVSLPESNIISMYKLNKSDYFNYISYDYIDDEGGYAGSIVDYGLDGQVDSKLNFKNMTSSVLIDGVWYELKTVENKDGVVKDGVWLPVTHTYSKYRFLE